MFGMIMAKSIYNTNGLLAADGLGLLALAGPPGWITAILGSAAMFGGLLVTGYKNQKANQIQVLPVSRYARPWIGGLEGYKITDFWQNLVPSPSRIHMFRARGRDRTAPASPASIPGSESLEREPESSSSSRDGRSVSVSSKGYFWQISPGVLFAPGFRVRDGS